MPPKKHSLSANDAVVLVMGETGAGKSTFIEVLTGRKDVGVGRGLSSGTLEVGVFPSDIRTVGGKRIILIDTPGTGNSDMPDSSVLENVAIWLAAIYKKRIYPTAILLLGKIDDYPLNRPHQKALMMFRSICGDDALKNVLLVSTMWNMANIVTCAAYETALRTSHPFWLPFIRRGSQVTRFYNTHQSALDVIQLIINKAPIPLQIQRELIDQRKPLDQTSAGISIASDLEADHSQLERYIRELEERIRINSPEDVVLQEEIEKELATYRTLADQAKILRHGLRRSPFQMIVESIARFFGARR